MLYLDLACCMCPEFLDGEKVENSNGLSQSTEQKCEIIYWILDPKSYVPILLLFDVSHATVILT